MVPVMATCDICSRKMQIQSFLTIDISDKSPDFRTDILSSQHRSRKKQARERS